MKKIALLFLVTILNLSCSAQEKEIAKENTDITIQKKEPNGTWKVDKEFDENGNMIRYDSIYSWSSLDRNDFANQDSNSLLQSFRSQFYRNFSRMDNQGFEDMFSPDSIFTKRFFNNDFFTSEFGEDFMDIDRMHKEMEQMQHRFLKKYQSEFEKDSTNNNN